MRKYLKNLRKKKGLSQKDVAVEIGIKPNAYCMIENGDRQDDMKLSVIKGLARAFGITAQEIIEFEDENSKTNARS